MITVKVPTDFVETLTGLNSDNSLDLPTESTMNEELYGLHQSGSDPTSEQGEHSHGPGGPPPRIGVVSHLGLHARDITREQRQVFQLLLDRVEPLVHNFARSPGILNFSLNLADLIAEVVQLASWGHGAYPSLIYGVLFRTAYAFSAR
jgi:hypothetical protein